MMDRRECLELITCAIGGASMGLAGEPSLAAQEGAVEGKPIRRSARGSNGKKVIILGIDGMDPNLLKKYVDEGIMPNFQRLISEGDFKPLQTSQPPQSPVAWSTFITGMDPGGHGIYDFIHRDLETFQLPGQAGVYSAMSRSDGPEQTVGVGKWVIPLSGGKIEQLRQGKAFWQILEEHGIPTTIYMMPANFPPVPSSGKSLSGMGTPDMRGTMGKYSYYTEIMPANAEEIDRGGGEVHKVQIQNNRIKARINGPDNTFQRVKKATPRRGAQKKKQEYLTPKCSIDFEIFVDPEKPIAKCVVQDDQFILQEGEWSDWVRLDFEAVPWLVNISAIGRFYLKKVRPGFELYLTPLQINPEDPAMPISTPEEWSRELFESLGYFYTKGLPADTKALSEGVFTGHDFWNQSQMIFWESRKALDYLLDTFQEGLLFFYFSSLDQGTHMLWRYMDPEHPAYVQDDQLAKGIQTIYQEIDEALGRVQSSMDENTTLIVMSDHGFCPFYYGVNLNSWLVEMGYLKLVKPAEQALHRYFGNVDWAETKAYAVGINGLYVNVKGREQKGIVMPGEEYEELLNELEADLLAMEDPRNGQHPISLVTRTHRDFHGPCVDIGPDIVVGYNRGYRCSWESPLGQFPLELFPENKDAWSGDHCMDHRVIPGVFLSNRNISLESPAIYDLTVAVLNEFGIEPLPEMIGKNCLEPRSNRDTNVSRKSVQDTRELLG
ncbi:MAG TPA: alkaline phosphatase family protein [bacterium]|nr:alkaline phosphatase family protein [bacterium]HQO33893.1 alkaline phosphatase family protein [bacterium]HQP99330.1 alkaline phosphatase family protein [bacterium]